MHSDHTTRPTPIKLCECGCGQPAPIANETRRRGGVVTSIKGQPQRFIIGHNRHKSDEERFWLKIDKRDPDECWLWIGRNESRDYGKAFWEGKAIPAHRLSYILHFGPIPDGMLACHKCDNPGCVNPAHLFLGTPADNMHDMRDKGRAAKGIDHGRAKFTEADIPVVKQLHAMGISFSELGRKYGVRYTTIRGIVRGETWKHVE